MQPLLTAEQLYAITRQNSPNTLLHQSSYNTGGMQLYSAPAYMNGALGSPMAPLSLTTTPVKPARKAYTITRERVEWKPREHELFVEGIFLYERDWKKIHDHIGGTKSIVQIRSHAQKHFIKLAKKGESHAIPAPKVRRKKPSEEGDNLEQLRNSFENNHLNGSIQLTDMYSMSRSNSYHSNLPDLLQLRSRSVDVNDMNGNRMLQTLNPFKSMTAPSTLPPRPPQPSVSPSYSMPLYPSNYTVQSSANISPFNVSPQPNGAMAAGLPQMQYSSLLPPPLPQAQGASAASGVGSYSVSMPNMSSSVPSSMQQGNYAFSNNEIINNTVDSGVNLPAASLQVYVARLKTMQPAEQLRHLQLLSINDRNVAMQMLQAEVAQQTMPTLHQQSGMFNQQMLAANNQLPYADAAQNYNNMQYRDYAQLNSSQLNPYANTPYSVYGMQPSFQPCSV